MKGSWTDAEVDASIEDAIAAERARVLAIIDAATLKPREGDPYRAALDCLSEIRAAIADERLR